MRTHHPFRIRSLLAGLASVAGLMGGTTLQAQTRSQAPPPMRGLGGVPAKAPGPIKLGGVRASFPNIKPIGPVGHGPQLKGGSKGKFGAAPMNFRRDGMGRSHGHVRGRSVTGTGMSAGGRFDGDGRRQGSHAGSGRDQGRHEFRDRGDGRHDRDFRRHDHRRHDGRRDFGKGNRKDVFFDTFPFFFSPWWYDNDYGDSSYSTIYGYYGPIDPAIYGGTPGAAPITEDVAPSTDKELGATYLMAGDAEVAARALRAWLVDNPGDGEAMRLLAVALVESGRIPEGVSMMSMAYHTDPGLAPRPISPAVLRTEANAREMVRRLSIYANRVKSGSAWLAVAVVMQAEGRQSTARPIVERARAAGLEATVADRLLASLN